MNNDITTIAIYNQIGSYCFFSFALSSSIRLSLYFNFSISRVHSS